MEIIVGRTAGFCYGVRNAVTKTEERLKEYKKIDCLGELVHNGEVIKKLENLGLNTVQQIEDAKSKVIIRAHGIPKETYEKAKKNNIEIYDYTCPNVLKIHNIAEEYSKKDYFIFLIGNKEHPETIGTISFCGDKSFIIENLDEIDNAIEFLNKSNKKKLLILVQTTFSLSKFNQIIDIIKNKLDKNMEIEIKNTICNATKIRQEETEKLSNEVNCMIIIGGKNSSNTKKLYEIAKENCKNVYLIENERELQVENIMNMGKIGIMAGASTPDESISNVVKKMKFI